MFQYQLLKLSNTFLMLSQTTKSSCRNKQQQQQQQQKQQQQQEQHIINLDLMLLLTKVLDQGTSD